jgi:O-antigen ligase/Tfp pilus assembly protein PilF
MKSFVKPIRFLFLTLLFFTPLIFTQSNSELFELPKMYFVYLTTILIVTFHLINVFQKKVPLFKKTFLDIPLVLFLISQIISTIYSIDPHTSFFGYYSRLNGGLLSLICYSLLYWTLAIYIDSNFKKKIINFSLLSALLVSIYAIAQHFGIDKNWWVQDVQSRVFSTFGQPNWLAAYFCIIIPFSISKIFNSENIIHKYLYLVLTSLFYISILFTKSKSGIIACLISIVIYFLITLFQNFKKPLNKSLFLKEKNLTKTGQILFILILFLILSITIANPIKDQLFPQKQNLPTIESPPSKILITSSSNIRKIVWKGAIDLWKKFPIIGTGVESFAYSYYWTRPVEHNLTSEWDYLYNKAHNEYINYLATTGIIGFITYISLILIILIKIFKNLKSNKTNQDTSIILTAFISILITNFAGFSVVTTSLFFFLLPIFLIKDKEFLPSKNIKNKFNLLIIPLILISLFLSKKIILFYLADISYNQAKNYDSKNNYKEALSFIQTSHQFNPKEPLYTDKLATIYSKIALNTEKQEDVDQAINYSNLTINSSPANINFWKQRAQAYLYLSGVDSKYFSDSIYALSKASLLAPTDAKIYYSIGQFLETANFSEEAIPYYQKAIELKPNYDHSYFALGKIYLSQKENQLAKENLQKTIDYSYPTNTEAENLLNQIK